MTVLHYSFMDINHLPCFSLSLQQGTSPLEIAANKGFPELAEMLLKAGADVNAINPVSH